MKTKPPKVLMTLEGRLAEYALELADIAQQSLARLGATAGLTHEHEVSLVLCDNPRIQRLNRRWRRIDRPTDVLSFPMHQLKPGEIPPPGPVGDIVISMPTTRTAARRHGIPLEDHFKRLLVHGLMHLMGYHHGNEREARRMKREEERLLGRKVQQ